ncbi:hypothetical protein [Chamaesiphon sp.]|uniref:hypothetical protein n=1 Tax=Chamaesiphon sp. TaxID=2814140 RepID=UPI0035947CCB
MGECLSGFPFSSSYPNIAVKWNTQSPIEPVEKLSIFTLDRYLSSLIFAYRSQQPLRDRDTLSKSSDWDVCLPPEAIWSERYFVNTSKFYADYLSA